MTTLTAASVPAAATAASTVLATVSPPAPVSAPTAVGFRRVSPSDAMAFAALMRDPAVYASVFDLPHPSVEQWLHALQRHGPNDHWLCAIAEDQLVGWGCITVQSDMRRRHAGVLGLAVARARWGCGVGTAVMREMLSLADDWLNLQRLELSVFTSNARAVALYQRHGFETEGIQRAHALRAGRFEDTYLMSRLHPRPASVAVRA